MSSPSTTPSPTPDNDDRPTHPYADYTEAKYGKEQEWLIKFLRNQHPYAPWGYGDQTVNIRILDSCDGAISAQTFQAQQSGEVDDSFRRALNERPQNSKIRLVLLEGGRLGDTNGAYVDAIGWQYRLDPFFFCKYFQHASCRTTTSGWIRPPQLPIPLPSKDKSIIIYRNYHDMDHMTAQIVVRQRQKSGKTHYQYHNDLGTENST